MEVIFVVLTKTPWKSTFEGEYAINVFDVR